MTMARSSCCLSRSASSLTTFCCIKCLIFAGSNLAEHVLCSLHAFQSLSNVHRCFQTIVVFITPVYPSVCPSICTSVHLFVCLTGVSVCIAFVCLSICTSVRTSVHTSVCLSVYASACLPVIDCCVCLCVCVQEPATTATGSPTTVYNASSSSARKLLQSASNVTATFGYTTSQAVASTFQSTFNTSQFNQALSVQGT